MQRASSTRPDRIVAVVVTYRRPDHLAQTIDRLLSENVDHIVVVDNDPTGTTAFDDPRVSVHRAETNLGGAGGFARGMGLARAQHDADWILVTDDDGRPCEGAIAAFRSCAPDDGRTAVTAAVYFPDGEICEMNRSSLNPFWRPRVFLRTALTVRREAFHISDEAYATCAPMDVDTASFVGLFIPAAAIDEVGLPDARLFIYGDDVLYSLTLRKAGFRLLFDPRVRFEHDCSTKGEAHGPVRTDLWRVYYLYRNALLTYRAYAGPAFWPIAPLFLLKWALNGRKYGPRRTAHRRLYRLAVADGLRRRLNRPHAEIISVASS